MPPARLRETRYDAAGQPVMRIAYARPTDAALRAGATLAQLLPAASRDDIVEHMVYDARGLLVADIDGEGYLTSYRYDGNGNRTETVRHAQALTNAQRAALLAGGIGATLPQVASLADQHQQFTYDLSEPARHPHGRIRHRHPQRVRQHGPARRQHHRRRYA